MNSNLSSIYILRLPRRKKIEMYYILRGFSKNNISEDSLPFMPSDENASSRLLIIINHDDDDDDEVS